jgi:hypothetical protein
MTQSAFVSALTHQLKWSVGENRFDTDGTKPKQMSLFVTQESILEFASYLQRLAGESDKLKPGKVWDFENQKEIEVQGFYLNGKGQTSQFGDFGSINLQQIPGSSVNTPTQAVAAPVDSSCPF